MTGRVGKRADDLDELGDRSRPAMRDQQRQRLRADAALVDEVNAEAADGGPELRKAVQCRFGRSPVVALPPIRDELPQVGEVRSIRPARTRDLVGKARARQALAKVEENGVRNGDSEGFDLHAARSTAGANRIARGPLLPRVLAPGGAPRCAGGGGARDTTNAGNSRSGIDEYRADEDAVLSRRHWGRPVLEIWR